MAVIAVFDDPRDVAQLPVSGIADDVHFLDVEAEFVQPFEALFDAKRLADGEVGGGRQLIPQAGVPLLEQLRDLPWIDAGSQTSAGLEIEQTARDILGGDLEVEGALAVTEFFVVLPGLHVDDICRECSGISAEQSVRQGAVPPEEPGEVQANQQARHCIEHPLAEVRNRQPATGQQRAIGDGIVQVTSDEHAIDMVGLAGHRGDHLRRGEPPVIEFVQESVLAFDEVVRQLLDDVADFAEFDQSHDVTVQAEHAVHAWELPIRESFAERQATDEGMLGRIGKLEQHAPSLPGRRCRPL